MGNIRAAVLGAWGMMALALNVYASDSSLRAHSVLASLLYLEKETCCKKYLPDQIRSIETHINQVIKNIEGDEFSPMYHKKMADNSCATWHKNPYLDNYCWAKEILYFLNCDFEAHWDYGCGPAGEGRWCCASIATCCIWPTLSIILASLGGVSQALVYGGSRLCCSSAEINEELCINTHLFGSFIQQKAIELKKIVRDKGISLTPDEHAELDRLSSVMKNILLDDPVGRNTAP